MADLRTSPEQYLQAIRPKRISDVFDSPVPSVATIVKNYGLNVARAALVFPLSELLDFFNVENTMSDAQVAFTINLLVEEYPYLKLDDYKMCFRKVMLGHYGKVYNRIDGQMILGWIHTYVRERAAAADEISYNEHKELKSTGGVMYYDEYRKELEREAAAGNEEAIKRLRLSDEVAGLVGKWKEDKLKGMLDGYEQWKKDRSEDKAE